MKFKVLFVIALLFIYASSCNDDEPVPYEPFDHEAQETEDRATLQTYMETHYINDTGALEEIPEDGDQTPIFTQVMTLTTTETHIDPVDGSEQIVEHKLYYYMIEEGVNESPTIVDRANVSYKGMLLDHEVFDQNDFGIWANLDGGVIKGWIKAIPLFKSGNVTLLSDESYEYSETGKGIIFIPSGLAYKNSTGPNGDLPVSSPLIFHIELNSVFRTDHDSDGILSMYEDVNNNGDFQDDDTDDNNTPNYRDNNDDGDDVDTVDENPDPNGDGNPDDAQDTDGDAIPDYLDSDTP